MSTYSIGALSLVNAIWFIDIGGTTMKYDSDRVERPGVLTPIQVPSPATPCPPLPAPRSTLGGRPTATRSDRAIVRGHPVTSSAPSPRSRSTCRRSRGNGIVCRSRMMVVVVFGTPRVVGLDLLIGMVEVDDRHVREEVRAVHTRDEHTADTKRGRAPSLQGAEKTANRRPDTLYGSETLRVESIHR